MSFAVPKTAPEQDKHAETTHKHLSKGPPPFPVKVIYPKNCAKTAPSLEPPSVARKNSRSLDDIKTKEYSVNNKKEAEWHHSICFRYLSSPFILFFKPSKVRAKKTPKTSSPSRKKPKAPKKKQSRVRALSRKKNTVPEDDRWRLYFREPP